MSTGDQGRGERIVVAREKAGTQGRMRIIIMQDKLDGGLFMKAEAQDMLASPNEFMR